MTKKQEPEFKELLFKWGTLKGWDGVTGKCKKLLEEYFKDGISMSCMTDRPDENRKKILCQLIDEFDGTFYNDWEGKQMTKDEAKKYVMEYGKQ